MCTYEELVISLMINEEFENNRRLLFATLKYHLKNWFLRLTLETIKTNLIDLIGNDVQRWGRN